MNLQKNEPLQQKRKWRIRKKVIGSARRPRVAVCFTNKNLHAQCIDDGNSHTLTSISSNEKTSSQFFQMYLVRRRLELSLAKGLRLLELNLSYLISQAGNIMDA